MEELYSVPQVAKLLKISRVAALKKVKNGQIQAKKVGRNYIITKEEVLKALGQVIGNKAKQEIDAIVKKGVRDYGEVFKKLGKE